MRFEEVFVGDILVAKVTEARIAADVAGEFKKALVETIGRGNRVVVLDLSALSFIDSMGLGGLVAGLKAVKEDGDLVLCGVRDTVRSMFKLTRMNEIFRIFDTADAAVAALSSSPSRPS